MNLKSLTPNFFYCNYCLHEDYINSFLIMGKGRILKTTYQCPDCKVIMREKTLKAEMTAFQYGKWVFEVKRFDLTKRLKMDYIVARVKQFGIANSFWLGYKEAKEEYLTGKSEQK